MDPEVIEAWAAGYQTETLFQVMKLSSNLAAGVDEKREIVIGALAQVLAIQMRTYLKHPGEPDEGMMDEASAAAVNAVRDVLMKG
jgi:hypothetical protein